jgi:hypothetical protein
MAALSAPRDTKESGQSGRGIHELPVDAGKVCYAGGIGCIDSVDGLAKPAVTATTLTALGRVERTADNAAGGDGAVKVLIKEGDFWFVNSASTDAIAATEIGQTCYLVDDQTVAKTNGTNTRSAAGKVVNVDAYLGVLVRIGI